ncbi:MAG TPA: thioredoxin-like domain-containing protein [Planctomycetaceae bacterium]|nr:thioredoxin-like domain-containing protein [Planctomycetaceae bacterium]
MRNRFPLETVLATPVIVCLLLAGVATAQDRREASAGRDAQDLQGEWQGIDFQTSGITVRDMKNRRWIIRDDQRIEFYFIRDWHSQESNVRFRLDPAKSPKQVDFLIHWRDPDWKDLTLLGIYALDRDRLTICTNNKSKRPTEFTSTKENGNTLSTFQRVTGDPSVTLAFAKIQSDWAEASPMAFTAGSVSELNKRKAMLNAMAAPDPEVFAKRYLQFAEAHPDGFAGLVALCRAAFLAPASELGAKALSLLEGGRVATADLDDLCRALDASRTTSSERSGEKALAPHVLAAAKRQLADPSAARTLTWVCVTLAKEQSTSAVFAESADLIVARFANSPDIVNLCELLGASPRWSAKVEQDLRTILDKNQDRAVCAAASFALASVVQRAGESRQNEAEALFEEFVKKFDGKAQYQYAAIEKMLNESARRELTELKMRALGKPAPEIAGIDLDGQGMTLSQFRGKVVLLSFWATWCRPSMQMVPHEKSLVDRLRNKPFELIGVNGDIEPERLKQGIQKYNITWRSFQNKAGKAQAISKKWNIGGWPTLYLIDQQGVIRNRWTDTVPPEELNRAVDALIAGKSNSNSRIESLPPTRSRSIWVWLGVLGVVLAAAIAAATTRRRSVHP